MLALLKTRRIDLATALGLALICSGYAYWRETLLDPVIFEYNGFVDDDRPSPSTSDIWFDSDIPKMRRIISAIDTDRHVATSEHPLMSATLFGAGSILRTLGLDDFAAIRTLVAVTAGLWTALLYALLRLYGCRRFDATLFGIVGSVSASAMFATAAPEIFLPGSVTILLALVLYAWQRPRDSVLRFTLINALTLSMTVTNWMVGIVASVVSLSKRNAWFAISGGFTVLTILWALQKYWISETTFFLGGTRTAAFIYWPSPSRALEVTQSFALHTVVMPAIEIVELDELFRVMSVQGSWAGTGSLAGAVATVAWAALLAVGGWAVATTPSLRLGRLCGLLAILQLALHLVFGGETFLYSMHFLPLLLVVAASAVLTKLRYPAIGLGVIVAIEAGLNNWWQFHAAVATVHAIGDWARSFL